MAKYSPKLLFTAFLYVISGSKLTDSLDFRPSAPRMCLDLCQDYVHSFSYIKEFLCGHVSTDHSIGGHNSSLICLTKDQETKGIVSLADKTGHAMYHKDSAGGGRSGSRKQLTTEALCNELHRACLEGKLEDVTKFGRLENINCRGALGRTPVMAAVRHAHEEVFDFLISHGCDISLVDNFNDSVLHVACKGGNVDIVHKLVVTRNYDLEVRGKYCWTPVMTAVYYGHKTVLDYLIKKGCNLFAVNEINNNVFHVACNSGRVQMVRYILSKGIYHIDVKGFGGRTPAMTAVQYNFIPVLNFLVSKGCNITAVDNDKNNILHVACIESNVPTLKYILSQKWLDIESRGYKGRSPVMLAVQIGRVEIFKFLVNTGSDLSAVDKDTNTILHLASSNGGVDMVKHILSKGMIDINSKGYLGKTPVMSAVQFGHRKTVELLIRTGCNLKAVDVRGNNILHMACKGGHLDMVKHLLTFKVVDVNRKNIFFQTPLQLAEIKGHTAIVDFLKTI